MAVLLCFTLALGEGGLWLRFVFQLVDGAVGVWDVVSFLQVDRLVDGAAFSKGVEVADFHDSSDLWDRVVWWDRDVSCG